VPGSRFGYLILPGIRKGGVAGRSEKCDRGHLASLYAGILPWSFADNPEQAQKIEMSFHGNYLLRVNTMRKIYYFAENLNRVTAISGRHKLTSIFIIFKFAAGQKSAFFRLRALSPIQCSCAMAGCRR
jgi:hypothetical protein